MGVVFEIGILELLTRDPKRTFFRKIYWTTPVSVDGR